MGLRFQKRIPILPGLWLNLSKSGVSLSVGAKNATVNIGRGGVTGSASVPGTGLGYRKKLFSRKRARPIVEPAEAKIAIRDEAGKRLATIPIDESFAPHVERLETFHPRVFATVEGGEDDGTQLYATPA